MEIVRKLRFKILLFFGIALLFFALRLPNLTLQPIFADEAIYIRWAQVMRAEPTLRFLPLSDGKTPLFMWLMMPVFKIFEDPLFAGRFLSIMSGFATVLGVLAVGWRSFNLRVGWWSAFLVTVMPYTVFFDRLALVDSMLAAFSVWSLFFAILLMQKFRLDVAMFLGYMLGGGMLTKPPGFFNLLVLPSTLLLFNWQSKSRDKRLLKIFGLWIVAIFIAMVCYNILKLGPGFQNLNSRNQDYVHSPTDLLIRPWDPFWPHLKNISDWFPAFLTWPGVFLVFGGTVLSFCYAKKNRYGLVLLIWSIVPLLIQMALLKTFTARYLLFSIPPLLILGAFAADWGVNKFKKLTLVVLSLLLLFSFNFNIKLLVDPQTVPLPREERRGYLEDWTAGYGFKDIAEFLIKQSDNGVVVVGTEGFFGTLPDGLQIYLNEHSHTASKERQVLVMGSRATVSAELRIAAQDHQTYFVTNKSRYPYPDRDIKLLMEFPKAVSKDYPPDAILFYKVFPLNNE